MKHLSQLMSTGGGNGCHSSASCWMPRRSAMLKAHCPRRPRVYTTAPQMYMAPGRFEPTTRCLRLPPSWSMPSSTLISGWWLGLMSCSLAPGSKTQRSQRRSSFRMQRSNHGVNSLNCPYGDHIPGPPDLRDVLCIMSSPTCRYTEMVESGELAELELLYGYPCKPQQHYSVRDLAYRLFERTIWGTRPMQCTYESV